MSDTNSLPPQTKAGCALIVLFLLFCVFGAYGAVRLVAWLVGSDLS